jgi:hypothetical protein
VSEYSVSRIDIRADDLLISATCMPKPVCPNMATATPLGPPGAQTAQKQHARLLKLDAQPSADRIRLPEGAARKVSASVRRACIPDT